MSDARVIKRYANRKLYDTQHSRYVTLEQISTMIREGDDVKIIDNKSKEDLTSVTLAQIIFEEEKKQKSFLPLQAMRNIIQTGGESIHQFVAQVQEKAHEAKQKVSDILPHKDEGEEGQDVSEESSETVLAESKTGPLAIREFREFLVNSQKTLDEWQSRIDDRIRNVVGGISPFRGVHNDMAVLADRISELEAKLAVLAEEEARALPVGTPPGGQADSGAGEQGADQTLPGESLAGVDSPTNSEA